MHKNIIDHQNICEWKSSFTGMMQLLLVLTFTVNKMISTLLWKIIQAFTVRISTKFLGLANNYVLWRRYGFRNVRAMFFFFFFFHKAYWFAICAKCINAINSSGVFKTLSKIEDEDFRQNSSISVVCQDSEYITALWSFTWIFSFHA